MAAYNAGETNVDRWVERAGGADDFDASTTCRSRRRAPTWTNVLRSQARLRAALRRRARRLVGCDVDRRRRRREEARRRTRQQRLVTLGIAFGLMAVVLDGRGRRRGGGRGLRDGRAPGQACGAAPRRARPVPRAAGGGLLRRAPERGARRARYRDPGRRPDGAWSARPSPTTGPGAPRSPAFELISTSSIGPPARTADSRRARSPRSIDRYLREARKRRALLILAIQPGRASFLDEVRALRPLARAAGRVAGARPRVEHEERRDPRPEHRLDQRRDRQRGLRRSVAAGAGAQPAREAPARAPLHRGHDRERALPAPPYPASELVVNVDGLGTQAQKKAKYREFTRGRETALNGFNAVYRRGHGRDDPAPDPAAEAPAGRGGLRATRPAGCRSRPRAARRRPRLSGASRWRTSCSGCGGWATTCRPARRSSLLDPVRQVHLQPPRAAGGQRGDDDLVVARRVPGVPHRRQGVVVAGDAVDLEARGPHALGRGRDAALGGRRVPRARPPAPAPAA